ncbi:ABC transporter permease [Anaerotruncus rubiinfantis]|uniref:ABC transporter permease n=1 Tax=Anaerotruncus rubiinfantis TaxID=1720200 RepID=UPI0018974F47|nr:ABC transporter permease [Anaerotruncus rubiinfantis]
MRDDLFRVVGAGWRQPVLVSAAPTRKKSFPWLSAVLLGFILSGCVFADLLRAGDPGYLDLVNTGHAPCAGFPFGTDLLGRDLFAMIWHGGRVSLTVGLLAAAIATGLAVVYGSVSGLAGEKLDALLMRACELLLSVPSILLVIFLQAIAGQANPVRIACVIGATSWMNMAKVVRSEVRQLSQSDYILAARAMNGSFWHVLRRHLVPNFIPSIMFMAVTAIGSAIGTESTLSFLGIGLPPEAVSWGSLLSQADQALLSNQWWLILIPGIFLVVTLVCITDLGNHIRREASRGCSNLTPD